MFEREIERDTALNFTKEAEFEKFTEELNAQSAWFTGYKAGDLEVVPVKSGSAPLPKGEFAYSTAECVLACRMQIFRQTYDPPDISKGTTRVLTRGSGTL